MRLKQNREQGSHEVPFVCPECSAKSLRITDRLELPPDSRSDEITLQVVSCSDCGFEALAVYEESRRGPLGDESFHHTGYYLNREDLDALKGKIRRCPKPKDHRCRCASHRSLEHRDSSGRWNALDHIAYDGVFELRL